MPNKVPTNNTISLSRLRFSFYRALSISFLFALVFLELVDFSIFLGYMSKHPVIKPILRSFFLLFFIISILDIGTTDKNSAHFAVLPLTILVFISFVYSLSEDSILDSFYYVSKIIYWISGTIFSYRMLKNGLLSTNGLQKTINTIVISYSIFVFYIFFISDMRFTQNIGIYKLVWCLPFLMIQEKSKAKSILILLTYWTIFITFKRGACLALILSSFTYALSHSYIKKDIRVTAYSFFAFVFLLIFFGLSLKIVENVKPEFFERRTTDLSDSERIGSGRGSSYLFLIKNYFNSINNSPINFFFGYGSRSVQKLTKGGFYAHSDWIQIIHDFGLFGLIVFCWLHISIIKLILIGLQSGFKYAPALVMNYTIFFILNIFSGMAFFPSSIFFGLFLSVYYFLWLQTNQASEGKAMAYCLKSK